MIINLKVVIKKLLSLINLIKAQIFRIYKLTKVNIVYKIKDFLFTVFWVVMSSFEQFNNSQKLTIISFISSFGKNHFSKKVYH